MRRRPKRGVPRNNNDRFTFGNTQGEALVWARGRATLLDPPMGSRSGDKLALGSARVESHASKEAQGKRREKKWDEEGTRGMEKKGGGNRGEGGQQLLDSKAGPHA